MAVIVQADSKNFNNLDEFCADSWDEATQINLNCYCHKPTYTITAISWPLPLISQLFSHWPF